MDDKYFWNKWMLSELMNSVENDVSVVILGSMWLALLVVVLVVLLLQLLLLLNYCLSMWWCL